MTHTISYFHLFPDRPVVCSDNSPTGWGKNATRPLGSAQHFDHVLLAQARFWNASKCLGWQRCGGAAASPAVASLSKGHNDRSEPTSALAPLQEYVMRGVARLLTRLISDTPYESAIPLLPSEGQSMYGMTHT